MLYYAAAQPCQDRGSVLASLTSCRPPPPARLVNDIKGETEPKQLKCQGRGKPHQEKNCVIFAAAFSQSVSVHHVIRRIFYQAASNALLHMFWTAVRASCMLEGRQLRFGQSELTRRRQQHQPQRLPSSLSSCVAPPWCVSSRDSITGDHSK